MPLPNDFPRNLTFPTGPLVILCLLLMTCDSAASEEAASPDRILFTATDLNLTAQVRAHAATYELAEDGGEKVLRVTYDGGSSKPGVHITAPAAAPWNLAGVHQLVAQVSNAGPAPQQVEMYVGNDPDGLVRWYCSDYVDLAPGQTATISVPLAWSDWVHEPQLGLKGMRGSPGQFKTDVAAIQSVTLNARYANHPNTFLIHEVRLVGELAVRDTVGFLPFMDTYGQYRHRDWPGKIQTEADFRTREKTELAELAEFPVGPQRNKFGGWDGGPPLKATGYFRTEKVAGKWWLVDPLGKLFWSTGLNCVQTGFGLTGIEGRENYFAGLPAPEDPLSRYYTQGGWASHGFYQDKVPFRAFNFYQANLHRKYGPTWRDRFLDRIHARFRSWGMTTLGNVSAPEARRQGKTPYVGTVWIRKTPKIAGASGFWGKFHDVFSPDFVPAVRASLEAQRAGADDPWCIGFFVDNELSWGALGSLTLGVLRSPADQPAKLILLKELREKYGSIAALNAVWETEHASWEALAASTTPPAMKVARTDLVDFHRQIAEEYFRIIHDELARIAPRHLYLGCRFAWANDEVTMRAAARYCDVVSFNKYEYSVENLRLPEGVDKPTMIGEFHFGSTDRGHFHPGVKVAADQSDRGAKYREYIQGALRNPQLVGAHWFQYTDQVLTGREDGENYNVGLVDVADTPYPELMRAVRETNYALYTYRTEAAR
ncbi:MAG: beta-agarase [Bacteroidota bacterium]